MKIEYDLFEAGWAEARCSDSDNTVRMTVSYLHDSLLQLTEAAIQLSGDAEQAIVVFMNEPGEHWLVLQTKSDCLRAEIRWYTDWASWNLRSENDFQLLTVFDTSVSEFREQVVSLLGDLLLKHGVDGYAELWCEAEFPMRAYERLNAIYQRSIK